MQRGADIRARENQSRFVQQRISDIEKHFATICQDVAAYARKSARLRDKGDDLAKDLLAYADSEAQSTKSGLTAFAERISSMQDYRQAEVERLENKVVQPLTLYGTQCKHTREDLKNSFAARDREINQQKKLERVRQKKPGDRHQISQAESKLQRATVDATRTNKALEDQMDTFERKRLQDIKKILSEFVKIEMLFHAKCLETLTDSFQCLQTINDEDDLEEFRSSLRPLNQTDSNSRLDIQRYDSKTSLNSTGASTNYSTASKQKKTKLKRQEADHEEDEVREFDDDEESDEDEEDEDDDEEDEDDEDDDDYRYGNYKR
ncbi:CBY1-interacting BAR domain-containing protein 1-like [Apostichopus japonicus]|uniref:CBY1-interacting BAR domain-containing protein 1-like n=1 Tax=Stichopus japonicus TaxID=307972 RepID=UPI003AB3D5FE